MLSEFSPPNRINPRRSHGVGRRVRHGLACRQGGFVTPVGWFYLILVLTLVVVVVGAIAWTIANANVMIAERTAELAANRGAIAGLQHLVAGVFPGTPFLVLTVPEPQRTRAVTDHINAVAVSNGILRQYLAPFQAGDIEVVLSIAAATVTVTARTGRSGQFVRTASRSAAVRAANAVDPGRVLKLVDGSARSLGVLPLAVEASAFSGLAVPVSSNGTAERSLRTGPVQIAFGSNAFPVDAADRISSGGGGEILVAAAEFLGFDGVGIPGGQAPPGFAVGQQVLLSHVDKAGARRTPTDSLTARNEGAKEQAPHMSREREITDALLQYLEGRAVIVPLVDGDRVQGFAVASIVRGPSDGLALELLPSALSPLAHFDALGEAVSPLLAQRSGLAMGLAMSLTIPSSDQLSGDEQGLEQECCGHEFTYQQAILSPVEIAG